MTNHPSGPGDDATTRIPRQAADDFQPDVGGAAGAAPPTEGGGPPLVPGAMVAADRYRLLVCHGGPPELEFWQALDTALDRQVALTFIDPDRRLPRAEVEAIMHRTRALSQVHGPGLARVLDVTDTAEGALVVAEWIRGGSLREVAETHPSALGCARAIQSLAAAADQAHQAGAALSVDHPSRIRVSMNGDVAVAFPATLAGADQTSDVRGIGGVLYALLVGRWPLPETGTLSGLPAAPSDPNGELVEPAALDGDIPFQISTVAVRAAGSGGGISTAGNLLHLLRQTTAAAERTESGGGATVSPVPLRSPGDATAIQARRRKTVLIGAAAGAVVLIVALAALAGVLGKVFGGSDGELNGDQLGLNTTAPGSSSGGGRADGQVVKPDAATVFSPQGGADAPSLAGLAIDGDPSTAWPTDTYTDAVPFPNFKNGVGLMLTLPEPTEVGSVSVTVSSTGTELEIRSATSQSPASLDDTTLLTGPVALEQGANTIPVPAAQPTSYLLVWISTMGQTNGQSRTSVSEITVRAAS